MFSYHKEDFIIRQIQNVAKTLAKLFFGTEQITYVIKDENNYTQSDLIYLKIITLIKEQKYLEAQTLLLNNIDTNDLQYLKIILFFYDYLDHMSDKQLIEHQLNRHEITNNFMDATSKYNCLI
ncbi:MAG: DUF6483 family protein [Thomasclavelia sp.]|uniref:DUF6483 family protein n=1 Tax=Thomasclavelia sp. TaxID=3025757 RepID=UPI0039A12D28